MDHIFNALIVLLSLSITLVREEYRFFGLPYYDILTVISTFLILISTLNRNRFSVSKGFLLRLGVLFATVMGVGSLSTLVGLQTIIREPNFGALLRAAGSVLLFISTYVMILGNERRVKLAASSLVLVALVQGLVAIGGIGSTSRFVGTFDDPNYFGVFQSMAFCIILSRLTGRTRFWEKLILYALLALVGLSVLITFSRGAYLALFGGFAVIIWARLKNAKTQIVFVIGTAALGIWHSLSLLESLPIVQRFVGRLNIIEAIQTGGTGRTDIWKRAVLSLGNNPWGYGWGTETVVLSGKVSHNVFLEVAIQYGVIGFLLTIFLLGLIIGDAVHLVKKTENEYYIGFAASVICVLVGGVSLNMWYVRQFWYVLAMCVALADNLRLREYSTST